MTLFCHPYFYKKFVTVLLTNVTVIFTNVTVFITKTDFDHLSPFLYTVDSDLKNEIILTLNKDSYSCYGFEWKQCEDSPLDILDESNCPIIEEEQVTIKSNPVRIELDDSLLERFNELSEDELKDSFGTFTPAQSLNPYMTKLSMCSVEQVWLALLIIRIVFIRISIFKSHIIFKSQ